MMGAGEGWWLAGISRAVKRSCAMVRRAHCGTFARVRERAISVCAHAAAPTRGSADRSAEGAGKECWGILKTSKRAPRREAPPFLLDERVGKRGVGAF